MFIKSHVGRTLINMTDVLDNWGDGIKMYITNYTINEFNRDYPSSGSFCNTPSSIALSHFPAILYEDIVTPTGDKPFGSYCNKVINTPYC